MLSMQEIANMQGELKKNILQNLFNNLTPHTVSGRACLSCPALGYAGEMPHFGDPPCPVQNPSVFRHSDVQSRAARPI